MIVQDKFSTSTPVGAQSGRVSSLDALDTNLIDVAIWSIMCDFKKWTAREIVDKLSHLGYNRLVADKRMDALIRGKKWFERTNGGVVRYTLRKDVRKPNDGKTLLVKDGETRVGLRIGENATVAAVAEATGLSSSVIIKFLMGKGMMVTINQMLDWDTIAEVAKQYNYNPIPRPNYMASSVAPGEDRRDGFTRPFATTPVISRAAPVEDHNPAQSIPEPVPAPKPVNFGTPPIESGDTIDLAIWKIMHDYQSYTASEVGMLLTEFGFKSTSVKPRMSVLHGDGINGWFTRIQDPANHKQFIYTLKREIEMPASVKTGNTTLTATVSPKMREIIEQAAPAPKAAPAAEVKAVVVEAPSQPTPKESEMSVALSAVPVSQAKHPLFAVDVAIKGKVYSLAEARELGYDLLEAGFGEKHNDPVPTSKFLKVMIEIGGEKFTTDEANDLALEMIKEGIIKKAE